MVLWVIHHQQFTPSWYEARATHSVHRGVVRVARTRPHRSGPRGTGWDGWGRVRGRGGWTAGRRATGAVGGGRMGVIRGVGGSEGVGGLYMLALDATNTIHTRNTQGVSDRNTG